MPPWAEPVSRRSVLKGAGIGALGLGAGGFLAACSNRSRARAAAAPAKITIGFVSPQTGALAGFASGDNFVVNRIRQTSRTRTASRSAARPTRSTSWSRTASPTRTAPRRSPASWSTPNHADLVVTTSTPETTNPVARSARRTASPASRRSCRGRRGTSPRQADPKNPKPFKYTTMYFFGVEAFGGCFVPMWNRVPTNKVVGGMFPNDADGNAFRAAWPDITKAAGYTFVDGGPYPDGTTDYTSMISEFKSQGLRDLHQRAAAARLQHVLEAGERSRATSRSSRPWPRCCCSPRTRRRSATS